MNYLKYRNSFIFNFTVNKISLLYTNYYYFNFTFIYLILFNYLRLTLNRIIHSFIIYIIIIIVI
jgi:hypothetical protein